MTLRHFRRANMANRRSGPPNDVIKRMKARAARKQKESEPLGIAQLATQNKACGRETTWNALLKQWREREMDWGCCWERNRWGKKPSRRCRGSNQAGAGSHRGGWKHRIDDQSAWKYILWDNRCYWRQSEQYRKFQWWGGWGRWGWWRHRAGPAEWRWRTGLGDVQITETVEGRRETFRQKQMKLDELTHPGWKDAADYVRETDKKYGTSELRVLAVVQPQTDDNTVAAAPTKFGELM